MRLAFIKKRFSFHGGAERYLQTLIGQLRESDHEIHVFSNQWTEEAGIIFHRVNIIPFPSFLSNLTFNSNVGAMLKACGDRSFDCIISFERTAFQDIYRAGEGCHAEWLRIRTQFEPFYKRVSFRTNPHHRLLLNLERRLFRDTKLIIANSRMVKEQILRHYGDEVKEDKIIIIYNGVDLERFSPQNRQRWREDVRAELNIPEDHTVILFVGSGFERKGLKTLIQALPLLGEGIRVIVIGKGKGKGFKRLASDANKVSFLGAQRMIERFYAAADLFILPTLYDPFSNATLEAMASGLPVITTKNNGVAELITNGKEGYVMESLSDPEELASKIKLSLADLDIMGKRARERAEAYSVEAASKRFDDVIKTICSHP